VGKENWIWGPSGGSTPRNTLSSRLLLTSSSIKGARIKRVEAEEVTGSGIRASSYSSFAKSKVRLELSCLQAHGDLVRRTERLEGFV